MLEFFANLDRRWVFLLMGLAVAVPILVPTPFPEKATPLVRDVFNAIDDLPEGSRVLLAYDFDPASEGELAPMATMFIRHCAEKKHKMYFMALWPVGEQMIVDNIKRVIHADFPHLVYGEDYVNLGYKAGNQGVIKAVVSDLRKMYTTDANGTPLEEIPMMTDPSRGLNITNIQQMDLMCNVSAGYPGTKEWVQYAATPYPDDIKIVAGCTGVQAPLLYPYIPGQLKGLLAAIKGASEYESLVLEKYGDNITEEGEDGEQVIPGRYLEGQRRMGPQLIAHLLMVGLILAGNVIFFLQRRQGARR